jgi:capsular polysaccharide export protein
MDKHQTSVPIAGTFLFLQGLASPFMYKLARHLRAAGHRVLRVNLSGADLAFWPERAINFRKRETEWPAFIARTLRDNNVSDIVLFGDCRPAHKVAIAAARNLGIATHLFEEGYIRPNWITLESWGTNGHSAIPRDPDRIRELASRVAEPAAAEDVGGSFLNRAVWDVTANLIGAALWPMFPHYRWHGTDHPFIEYAGWIGRFARTPARRRRTRETLARVVDGGLPFYLMPLQLHSDFQIRVHSPYAHPIDAAGEIVASFARHAPPGTQLLFKLHPLDNGLFDYPGNIAPLAERAGVSDRIHFVDDGVLSKLLQRSRGIVLVNSSIGTMALELGCAVKALGTATYDMPGLTFQGPLDDFWTTATKPDPELYRTYRRVVVALTQVNGGFFDGKAIEIGTRHATDRILAASNARRSIAARIRSKSSAPSEPETAPPLAAGGAVVPGE